VAQGIPSKKKSSLDDRVRRFHVLADGVHKNSISVLAESDPQHAYMAIQQWE